MSVTAQLVPGNALEVLRGMEAESVDCVVTSPPYWNLRSYGDLPGEMGREPTIAEYVERMVEVFREVRRVLKKSGTCWVNISDSYASGKGTCYNPGGGPQSGIPIADKSRFPLDRGSIRTLARDSLKPKDRCGIPERLVLALQADGWWWRDEIIWHKPAPMPMSRKDATTPAHEKIYLLTKAARYWSDFGALATPASPNTHARISQNLADQRGSFRAAGGNKTNGPMKAVIAGSTRKLAEAGSGIAGNRSFEAALALPVATAHPRSVWTFSTAGFSGAHFATFPPELARRCILAGCPPMVCAKCGVPFVPQMKRTTRPHPNRWSKQADAEQFDKTGNAYKPGGSLGVAHSVEHLGYAPACQCDATTQPGLVLDLFVGSGTTCAVALSLGRNSIGIDLNPEYLELARKRIAAVTPALPFAAALEASP